MSEEVLKKKDEMVRVCDKSNTWIGGSDGLVCVEIEKMTLVWCAMEAENIDILLACLVGEESV